MKLNSGQLCNHGSLVSIFSLNYFHVQYIIYIIHALCILAKTDFQKGEVEILEKWIDGYHLKLPTLKNFILPVSHSVLFTVLG